MRIDDVIYVLINKKTGEILGDGECCIMSTSKNYIKDYYSGEHGATIAYLNGCEPQDLEIRKLKFTEIKED